MLKGEEAAAVMNAEGNPFSLVNERREIHVVCSACSESMPLSIWNTHNCTMLAAADVQSAKLDREPWSGRVRDEIKLAVAEQILRSIATEQIGASASVKALAASYFEAVK
jgi:hypothetical protein